MKPLSRSRIEEFRGIYMNKLKLLQEELKKEQSLNDIAKNISDTTGLRKNYLYKLLVKIKNDL